MNRLERPKILLVEDDARIVEAVVDMLSAQLDARMTCVCRPEDAMDIQIIEPHDIVIAEINLAAGSGLTLADQVRELGAAQVILTSREPTLSQAIESVRLGVCDFFVKPFDIDSFQQSVRRAWRQMRDQRIRIQRHQRLRAITRRVIRERRDLNRRVDLICRDLVGAHRRLVHRMMDLEKSQA